MPKFNNPVIFPKALMAGLTFEKVPVRVLKLIFGAFLLYGALRYLR